MTLYFAAATTAFMAALIVYSIAERANVTTDFIILFVYRHMVQGFGLATPG